MRPRESACAEKHISAVNMTRAWQSRIKERSWHGKRDNERQSEIKNAKNLTTEKARVLGHKSFYFAVVTEFEQLVFAHKKAKESLQK